MLQEKNKKIEKIEKYFNKNPIKIIEFENSELEFEPGTSRSIRMQNMSSGAQYFEGQKAA